MRSQVKIAQRGIEARKRKRLAWLAGTWTFVALLAFFGLAWLSQASFMSIEHIDVTGAVRVPPDRIQAIAGDAMAGNYWGLFSKRNILLYPARSIEGEISALPAVLKEDVGLSGIHRIHVSLTERSEVARWCAVESIDCFSVDENGFIFDQAEASSSFVIYYGAPRENPIGTEVASRDAFRQMQFFIHQLDALHISPTAVYTKDAGYAEVALESGGRIILNVTDDLSEALGNLSTVLSDRSLASSTDAFLSSLDYIRLDAGNKVFYKLK